MWDAKRKAELEMLEYHMTLAQGDVELGDIEGAMLKHQAVIMFLL